MNIIFNTRYPDSAASYCYRQALSSLDGISFFDYDNYGKYDIALFMSYEKDLLDLADAKKKYPDLKIGLIDARGSLVNEYRPFTDFLVVDSIEMSDFFAGFGVPIFTYYEYPKVEKVYKEHKQRTKITIGYHGNKVHLMGMYPNLTKALELLAERHNIELLATYNVKNLGKWKFGVPKNMPVEHVQWHEGVYNQEFARVDIGIVPAVMPIRDLPSVKRKAVVSREIFNDSDDDYLIRFKMLSNPGRIAVFGQLGIPVVADFFPSAMQTICHGVNGFLAYSSAGWYRALDNLILNHELRQVVSSRMHDVVSERFDYDSQNTRFRRFLNDIASAKSANPKLPYISSTNENLMEDLSFRKHAAIARLKSYARAVMRGVRGIAN